MDIKKHQNKNGTYNGVGAMSDLTGLRQDELARMAAEIKANSAKLRACPYHEFEQGKTSEKYACRHCGGEVNYQSWLWHEQGRRARPS